MEKHYLCRQPQLSWDKALVMVSLQSNLYTDLLLNLSFLEISFGMFQVVRETAIQCLVAMTGLPYTRIYPMRTQVGFVLDRNAIIVFCHSLKSVKLFSCDISHSTDHLFSETYFLNSIIHPLPGTTSHDKGS